jgi:hypothetical protein
MKLDEFTALELLDLLLSDFADLYDRQQSIYGLSDHEGQLARMREIHSTLQIVRLKVWSRELPEVCTEESERPSSQPISPPEVVEKGRMYYDNDVTKT